MEAGTIVRWLKSEGDTVEKGEPLYELDTDKVTQEVEADASGVLLKIAVEEGEVEVGYRLVRSAWGKGYATEGSRALIERGFTSLGVRRVVASTMVVNIASRRVLEKAGMRLVRTFHQPWPYPIEGDEHGDVEYALLRSEWEQAARS